MKRLIFILLCSIVYQYASAQIQTKFWEVTLGTSTYKQVYKYCKQFKGHYKGEYENFWGSRNRTIENETNSDPLKGDIFIRPFNLINFAGGDWKVTFIFQDNKLCSVEMLLSRYDKRSYSDFRGRKHITDEPLTIFKQPSEDFLNSLIQALLNKYNQYFQPEESNAEDAYIFFDGKTICKLQLMKNGKLYLTYSDYSLLNKNKQSLMDEL